MVSTLISFVLLAFMYLNHEFIKPQISPSFILILMICLVIFSFMLFLILKDIYLYNIKTVSIINVDAEKK